MFIRAASKTMGHITLISEMALVYSVLLFLRGGERGGERGGSILLHHLDKSLL